VVATATGGTDGAAAHSRASTASADAGAAADASAGPSNGRQSTGTQKNARA